jgi:hypothetical protein
MASPALGRKAWHTASWSSTSRGQRPEGSQPTSAKTRAPSSRAICTQVGSSSPSRTLPSPSAAITALARGGRPMSSVGPMGGGCPWLTMPRSRWTAMETVTGECQPSKRRERLRSMCSNSAKVSQQKSPYASSPKAAAREVRSPSRRAATARLAIPPGHEPIPSAQISSPPSGSRSRPVKMMSRKTVPQTKTSMSGSPSVRSDARGSYTWSGTARGSCLQWSPRQNAPIMGTMANTEHRAA